MVELECIPYGVGHADEGVCLLVRMGPYRILLDCGLNQVDVLLPPEQRSSQPKSGQRSPGQRGGGQRGDLPADLVLCSHAHADHARGLLALHRAFPRLPIYASEVTTQLLPLNWPEIPAAQFLPFCQALPWRSPIEFGDGLTVKLFPAGHLPGATAFLLTYTPSSQRGKPERVYTVFYTGDFFLSNSRLVEGFPLEELRSTAPDVLIVEGSFGTARHPHRRQQENQLAERITQALKQGFSVVLPVPVLGLAQELLMLLRSHHYFTGQNLDIWVEEAIAAGCDAYLDILPHLPSTVRNFAQHQPLFWDQRVRPRVQRLQAEQRDRVAGSPCIVLADKQVDMNAYCQTGSRPWLLLLPRHSGTASQPGWGKLDPFRQAIEKFAEPIRAGQLLVETYLLAEHSDGPGTTQLIHNLRPQHVVFIHGSPTYLADLTALDELSNRYHLHCPAVGTPVELPIGDRLIQPTAPDPNPTYEGEVTELTTMVTISLPIAVTSDPRWQAFADTGLVNATWQGEDLVLRGLSPKELLVERFNPTITALECCATCQYYRGQRCWNTSSPLFEFKVSPDGYCPAYAAARSLFKTEPGSP
uniref:Beta-lactamase domain protein n=1 Tax=Cyanothece sp. (strain PCC 7425 / ATCC 29141) TaxID=395961 RepID=B8HVZ6_CYAP4